MKARQIGIQVIVSTKLTTDELTDCVDNFIKEVDESNCSDMSFVTFMTKKQIDKNVYYQLENIQNRQNKTKPSDLFE